jgi:hypothetical protein
MIVLLPGVFCVQFFRSDVLKCSVFSNTLVNCSAVGVLTADRSNLLTAENYLKFSLRSTDKAKFPV